MPSNKIISSKAIGSVTIGGKQVALAIATRTQNWNRTEDVALAQASGFKESVEKSTTPLPAATAKITQRLVPFVFRVLTLRTHCHAVKANIQALKMGKTTILAC